MASQLYEFVHAQLRELPMAATPETCAGRAFIVTGANSGIGFETAKHLVRLQASKVILAVRSTKAGERAKADIEGTVFAASGKKGVVVEVWPLNLGSYASVRAFARRAVASLERIDGLVENAAIALDRWTAAEGNETSVTVNVFSNMLLAGLLLPKMAHTARTFDTVPHLVFVTSSLAFAQRAQLEKLGGRGMWDRLRDERVGLGNRYAMTKLLNLYAAIHFATLFPASRTGVVVNFANPGLCKTGLVRYCSLKARIQVEALCALLGRTSEMGSRAVLYALVGGESSHGQYLSDCENKNGQVPSWMTDVEGERMQKYIWDGIAEMLDMVEPGLFNQML
ncbi:short-chain dehydrogenase [Biscogniauxia mediterranea]|nr:short-chain dehydrogenase [Biscogniauxia mediterranea]